MKAQTAFAAAFIAALFLPPLLLDRTSIVSQKENRNLAQKPAIIKDGGMNRDYFSQLDAWLGDRFGLREPLVALDSVVKNRLESKYALTDRALEGKDGWIFYIDGKDGANLVDFYKLNLLDEATLSRIEDNVRETVEWCAEHGIKVLYFIAPNKHSVYSEYYPFDRPEGITRGDQIAAAINAGSADCLFPRDLLLEKKATAPFRLYFKTDTHWNSLGVYYAYEVLRGKIEALFPETQFPQITYRTEIQEGAYRGDLISMLNKQGMEETGRVIITSEGMDAEYFSMPPDANAKPSNISVWYEYLEFGIPCGRTGVHTRGKNADLPRALVFRDSFFIALEPLVSPLFSEVEYVWKYFTDADKKRILEYKPDIVIFEHVERYAPNLGLVR